MRFPLRWPEVILCVLAGLTIALLLIWLLTAH